MRAVVTGICWALIVAIWIVAAFGHRRTRLVRQPLGRGTIWRLGAVVVVGLVYGLAGSEPDRLTTYSWWFAIPGLVLLLASTAFTIWARLSLGTMWSIALMLLGTALLNGLGFWIGLPIVGVAVFAAGVHIEEGLMPQTFPEDYERYRRRVPRLIPGLRRR
jgi:protein-S-isoprenylcysteine O-methyltransferase Ste14